VILIAAQIFIQLGLLVTYGQALGARLSSKGTFYRLLDHHPEVHDAPHPVNFRVDIGIGDDHAETIWMEPPAALVYRQIHLPAQVIHFRCRIAIHPHVWSEGGADGAEFALEIRADDGGVTTSSRRVWIAAVDPTHRSEQQAWLPVEVDLSQFAGKTVDLILKNGAGPANNDYADWCLWADPELVQLGAPNR
jgi:hypothetical protein